MAVLSVLGLMMVNQLRAQTGMGCFSSTCAQPGQIRLDAFVEQGELVSGCNCACNPALYDPTSPWFCDEPFAVNFDPSTLLGDCSCSCDPATSPRPEDCIFPTVYNAAICDCGCPSWAPSPGSCALPTEFVEELCQCACPGLGSVGGPCIMGGQPVPDSVVSPACTCSYFGNVVCPGPQEANAMTGECECPVISNSGAYFPVCEAPLVKDPATCDCMYDPLAV